MEIYGFPKEFTWMNNFTIVNASYKSINTMLLLCNITNPLKQLNKR